MPNGCMDCVHLELSWDNGRLLHYCDRCETIWYGEDLTDAPCEGWEVDDVEGLSDER